MITIFVKCENRWHLKDKDSLEQIRKRNSVGCKDLSFLQQDCFEVLAASKIRLETIEIEKDCFQQELSFDAICQFARSVMRQVRRLRRSSDKFIEVKMKLDCNEVYKTELFDKYINYLEDKIVKI